MTKPEQDLLSEAELDALLGTVSSDLVSPSLRARVAEIPILHPHPEAESTGWLAWWPWTSAWRVLVAGTLAATLGIMSGVLMPDEETSMSDDGWDDVASIAFVTGIEEEP